MKILVTNDDSYKAKALDILANTLKKYGEVIVYAPVKEQSCKSHSMTFFTGIKEKEVKGRNYICHKVYGTPGDCVRLALSLYKDIDLVVSGINDGFNIGNDILYSGTVSAAIEANLHGVKAIALSTYRHYLDHAYPYLEEVLDKTIKYQNFLDGISLLNVNFPKEYQGKGIIFTKMGLIKDITEVEKRGKRYFYTNYNLYYEDDLDIDFTAIENGYISISPLWADRTDYKALEKLKKLG